MKNIELVTLENANSEAKEVLESINKKLGKVPNIYAGVAQSPSTLKAVLNYKENLSQGNLSPQEVEALALGIAQVNDCQYCLAAHTVIGKMSGLSEDEVLSSRKGDIVDPKLKALVVLAKEIIVTQGHPSQGVVDNFFAAGYDQAALVEVIGHVSANIFTNYFNHIAETDLDFPKVKEI